jgi:hypothetical protein
MKDIQEIIEDTPHNQWFKEEFINEEVFKIVIGPTDSMMQLLQSLESEAHPLKSAQKLCF